MESNLVKLGLLSVLLVFCGTTRVKATPESNVEDLSIILQKADTLSRELSNYMFLRLNMDSIPPRMDTITYLYNQYIGELEYLNDESVPMRYIAPDPYYYRILTPLVYYNSPINQYSLPKLGDPEIIQKKEPAQTLLDFNKEQWTKISRTNKIIDGALIKLYMNDMAQVVTTEDKIRGRKIYYAAVPDDKDVIKKPVSTFFQADKDLDENLNMVESFIKKPNWWLTGGAGSLQISQNYISTNWHKGGESTNSLFANIQLFANYNDKEKLQFENIIEAKFGFNTLSSDTIRRYRINNDLLRLSSKLGIRAASNWYYTLSGEFNTQFAPNYKKNSDEMVSSFLAPANLIIGLGMDYKLKKKKINLSVMISPATYNIRYVRNKRVNEVDWGLKEGREFMHDVGSKVESRVQWKILPFMEWNSRLWYFTNYEKVEADWENTFNFILNRYLSTQIFVHTRFDDGVKRVPDKSYFQLKELLSFGINYKW
ncbi:hypothetical protein Bcop_2076 [Bacteroides coprosuis DSM 18011]|uniref:DUF3078 domain-containing protein n=1 Tax=Bacteroides coprosuis DSM 18011 TaxID=679937 RepID=F3ZT82_9BACE|nr:DUF3078 domain-containing protein [Bacteroides coprosuis]EGJ72250.1 hypothetical protein Bcop_2076 [Bacteroides coprosuis DSM 18011]